METEIIKYNENITGRVTRRDEKCEIVTMEPDEWTRKIEAMDEVMEETRLKTVVYTDRMGPVLNRGDIVLFKKLKNLSVIQWGEIHLVQTGEYNIICRVRPGSTPGNILISYEADSVTQEFPLSTLRGLWILNRTVTINM